MTTDSPQSADDQELPADSPSEAPANNDTIDLPALDDLPDDVRPSSEIRKRAPDTLETKKSGTGDPEQK